MSATSLRYFSAIAVSLLFFYGTATAQWSNDPMANNPICVAAGNQQNQIAVTDGGGGALITWEDNRNGNNDIFTQRINSSGVVQWISNGVSVCSAQNSQQSPNMIADGTGGAFIAWMDYRSGNHYDIYVQRINSNGDTLWQSSGIGIGNSSTSKYSPNLLADGSGGAIICWMDARSDGSDIYAQRINSNGEVQWTESGVPVSVASNYQSTPRMVADGGGGAIIAWRDNRSGSYYDIYAQKINSGGTVQWTANGVVICTAANDQSDHMIVGDNAGGAIISWSDYRSGTSNDIYAQRINSGGTVQWTANGVAICNATNTQEYPKLAGDGSGGAIITWNDYRDGTYCDVYAQRINASGSTLWTANGLVVSSEFLSQYGQNIVSDNAGGAIIAWIDTRIQSNYDIYAQRINSNGTSLWTKGGMLVCGASNYQYNPALISNNANGAVIIWYDSRNSNYDIFASNVDSDGNLLVGEPSQWWSTDPNVNNQISKAANSKDYPIIVSDGNHGAIITWQDNRIVGETDIYSQRIDANGINKWTAHGVPICTAVGTQIYPRMIADGTGGAIITWADYRNGISGGNTDIYAQKINTNGIVQWTANGVGCCTASNNQENPSITGDGSGGAIITWHDNRNGSNAYDIYAQKINSAGIAQWTAGGVIICNENGDQNQPLIASDGAGGAIIVWRDYRWGSYSDIYAKKISSSGSVSWGSGTAICAASYNQTATAIMSDDSGGAFIVWADSRGGTYYDIYAQRVNSSGVVQWTSNGVVICNAANDQTNALMTRDGSGGAIIVWWDMRGGSYYDLYAQRINSSGVVQWTQNGVAICSAERNQVLPSIISDNAGGAIITWQDMRGGTYYDIYVQKINSSGIGQWTPNGMQVCTAPNDQGTPTIVSDGTDGVIITWKDRRNSTNDNIFASRINQNGFLPVEFSMFDARSTTNGIELIWKTDSEVNNYGFEVERKAIRDEKQKIEEIVDHSLIPNHSWSTIGFIQGAGTSNAPREYAYSDVNLSVGRYEYRLKQIDLDGSFKYSTSVEAWFMISSELVLHHNFPNPFNPTTVIQYTVAAPGNAPGGVLGEGSKAGAEGHAIVQHIRISIFDLLGRERAVLVDEKKPAGNYSVTWNASSLPSGIYFCALQAGTFRQTTRMVLLR